VLSRQRITSRRAFALRLGKRRSRVSQQADSTAVNLDDTDSRHTGRTGLSITPVTMASLQQSSMERLGMKGANSHEGNSPTGAGVGRSD